MCIHVYANGLKDGKSTHISVYAALMRGENDDHLPWPFTGKVTFTLLNQLEDQNHHSKVTKFLPETKGSKRVMNREISPDGYGHQCFIPHTSLDYDEANLTRYLEDDCLYFRITVDAKSSFKPWLV